MKKGFLNDAEEQYYNAKSKRDLFLDYLKDFVNRTDFSEKSIAKITDSFESFCVSVLEIRTVSELIIKLLQETLIVVMKIVIAENLSPERFVQFNEQTGMINTLTFLLDQIKENRLNSRIISEYLNIISNTEFYIRNVLYLYRVNREFIGEMYKINLSEMNAGDVYHGIVSGYITFTGEDSECIEYLLRLCYLESNNTDFESPLFVLNKLNKEGYISKECVPLFSND